MSIVNGRWGPIPNPVVREGYEFKSPALHTAWNGTAGSVQSVTTKPHYKFDHVDGPNYPRPERRRI